MGQLHRPIQIDFYQVGRSSLFRVKSIFLYWVINRLQMVIQEIHVGSRVHAAVRPIQFILYTLYYAIPRPRYIILLTFIPLFVHKGTH